LSLVFAAADTPRRRRLNTSTPIRSQAPTLQPSGRSPTRASRGAHAALTETSAAAAIAQAREAAATRGIEDAGDALTLICSSMPRPQCVGTLHARYTVEPGANEDVESAYEPDPASGTSVSRIVEFSPGSGHVEFMRRTTLWSTPDH